MGKRETRSELITAFWKLYEKKQIEQISVRELCQEAGYNRTTFYVYFKDIYDLLEQAVGDLFEPIVSLFSNMKDMSAFLQGNLVLDFFLKLFPQNRQYLELLFKRQQYFFLGERIKDEVILKMKEYLGEEMEEDSSLEILLTYHISAAFGVMRYWIQSGKKTPSVELVETIYEISNRGVLPMLRAEFEKAGEEEHVSQYK